MIAKTVFGGMPRAVVVALASLWGSAAWAAAGQVQFVAGEVTLVRAQTSQAVVRGMPVELGDELRSGASGQAQIRFTDGGIVALYPQSQISITAYSDSDSAQAGQTQDGFGLRFVQGALRAITGKIAKRNPQGYQVTTPTAVVGVRGTAFKVLSNEQGEIEISGEHNTIDVCTQAGCVEVKPREAVRVLSADQLPLYTQTRALLPLPLPRTPVQAGEQLLPDGSYGAVLLQRVPPPPQPPQPEPPPTPGQPTTPTDPGPVVPTPGQPIPPIPGTPTDPGRPTTPGTTPGTPTTPGGQTGTGTRPTTPGTGPGTPTTPGGQTGTGTGTTPTTPGTSPGTPTTPGGQTGTGTTPTRPTIPPVIVVPIRPIRPPIPPLTVP